MSHIELLKANIATRYDIIINLFQANVATCRDTCISCAENRPLPPWAFRKVDLYGVRPARQLAAHTDRQDLQISAEISGKPKWQERLANFRKNFVSHTHTRKNFRKVVQGPSVDSA